MKDFILNNWWQLLLMVPLAVALAIGFVLMLADIYTHRPKDIFIFLFIILAFVGIYNIAKAETFDYRNGLTIEAKDFRTAAKHCYKKLNPVFITEEKALDAIDICVNPVRIRK